MECGASYTASMLTHPTLYGSYTESIHLCDVDADDDDGMKSGRLQFVRCDFKIDLSRMCVAMCSVCIQNSTYSHALYLALVYMQCNAL